MNTVEIMEKLHRLLNEITQVTNHIKTNYPGLYQFLDEDPLTIPSKDHPEIDVKIMQKYLESLKGLLPHHLRTHKKK